MKTPPTPASFTPEGSVPGVEIKSVKFLADRPFLKVKPRLLLVHTNAASVEGDVDSAWNFSHANPNNNTLPHYQVDRTHNGVVRARKMLPTNRRSIANATVKEFRDGHGDVSWFSISIETADLGFPMEANGFKAPGGTIGFDPLQGELIAQIIAYESIVHGFPIATPKEWFGSGVACHTEPFGFPHWTIKKGKECPGTQKKIDIRERIMPPRQRDQAGLAQRRNGPSAGTGTHAGDVHGRPGRWLVRHRPQARREREGPAAGQQRDDRDDDPSRQRADRPTDRRLGSSSHPPDAFVTETVAIRPIR